MSISVYVHRAMESVYTYLASKAGSDTLGYNLKYFHFVVLYLLFQAASLLLTLMSIMSLLNVL